MTTAQTGPDESSSSTATSLPATSLLPEESSTSGSTGAPPELDECTLSAADNALVTGTIDGEPTELAFSAFATSGGGMCPWTYKLVLLEDRAAFDDRFGDPPVPNNAPVVEAEIEMPFGDPLPPGEYTASVHVEFDGAQDVYGEAAVVVDTEVLEEVGAVLEGSIEVMVDDPPIALSGTFASPVCTDVGNGICGS